MPGNAENTYSARHRISRRAFLEMSDADLYRLLRRGEYLWPEEHLEELSAAMRRIRRDRVQTGVPLMVTGGFRSAAAMQRAITDDGISMIGIGRPLCVDQHCIAELLAGTRPVLGQYEKILNLGPGVFGPHSRYGVFKMLNAFGATYWFYQQFRRIGAGQPVDMKLGVFSALIKETLAQLAWVREAKKVQE